MNNQNHIVMIISIIIQIPFRSSWGNPDIPGVVTKLAFLLGRPEDSQKQEKLQEENKKHRDIVQGDFLDTYHNLSYKAIMGNLWVSEFCDQAEFVVKTDDDMFIDLYEVRPKWLVVSYYLTFNICSGLLSNQKIPNKLSLHQEQISIVSCVEGTSNITRSKQQVVCLI